MPQGHTRILAPDNDASPIKVASIENPTAGYGTGVVMKLAIISADLVRTQIGSGTQDDIQTLTFNTPPSSGAFKIQVPVERTGPINYNASALIIQEALRKTTSLNNLGVTVTGPAGGPFVITTPTKKMPPFQLDAYTIETSPLVWVPTRTQIRYYEGLGSMSLGYSAGKLYWSQIVQLTTGLKSGTMVLTFQGMQSSAIPYNATASQVKAALAGWYSLYPTEYDVVGGPFPDNPILITFGGRYQFNGSPIVVATHSFGSNNSPIIYGAGKQLFVAKQSASGKYLVIRTPFL